MAAAIVMDVCCGVVFKRTVVMSNYTWSGDMRALFFFLRVFPNYSYKC